MSIDGRLKSAMSAAMNDTAARYCEKKDCKAELVNPNDKLSQQHAEAKRDPYGKYTERVLFFTVKKTISNAGNETLQCEYTTPTVSFRAYYLAESHSKYMARKWTELNLLFLVIQKTLFIVQQLMTL